MTTSVRLRINVLKYFQIFRKFSFVSNLLAFQLFCLAASAESLMFPDFLASGTKFTVSISSQARYDHFDTLPFINIQLFSIFNMISSQPRYDHFGTSPK